MDHPPEVVVPAALAPLYGREHDLTQLQALLQGGARLLTLRGPGGIGKTVLALHLAHAFKDSSVFDHVQFTDLSAIHAPEQVLGLIAASLPDEGQVGSPARRIQDFAAARRTLLVLDNFEQVLPAAAALGELLAASATLRLLVTSRTVLRLYAEVEYPVGPLALAQGPYDAAFSPAVQLFVARVQAVTPSFALDAGNAPQVARLCEVLEGVPLALELAAVRTRSLALGDLLARLERPLNLLKADFRDRPERLNSLRAAAQWSYDLLDDADRAMFGCCAVFDGPFTPQALEAVWGSEDVLDRAESLIAQSFLQRLDTPETLWKMLQPLRELALETMECHPQEVVWRERHALYFLEMVEAYQRHWQLEGVGGEDAYRPHYPNIRAGLVWTIEQRRSDLAYAFLSATSPLWGPFELLLEEAPLVERVLALPPPHSRAALLGALKASARYLEFRGELQACEETLGEILELCRELGDVDGEIQANFLLAMVLRDAGQAARAWDIRQWIVRTLREQVGERRPTRKQHMFQAQAHLGAAQDLLELGQHALALEYAQQACQDHQELGSREGYLTALTVQGLVLVCLHRVPEARTLLLFCLRDAVGDGVRGLVGHVLRWGLNFVAGEQRAWTTLVQFTAFLNDPVGERSQGVLDLWLQRNLTRARLELGEAAYQHAWITGRQLQLPDVLKLAERLAEVPLPPSIRQHSHLDLTPREREVLTLVSLGHPDRRIARLLGVSPATASKHVSNLLGKLGLRNRVELTRWAIEHGSSQEGPQPSSG